MTRSIITSLVLSLAILGYSLISKAELAANVNPVDLSIEIPVVKVGDSYFQATLRHVGELDFELASTSLLTDVKDTAATFNAETRTVDLPMVKFNDAWLHVELLFNGSYFTVTRADAFTPDAPRIKGTVIPPDIFTQYTNNLPSGGVNYVCLHDLLWQQIGDCQFTAAENSTAQAPLSELVETLDFEFTVERGKAYIVSAVLGNGGGFSLITDTMEDDLFQDLDLSAEVEFNLIYTTAFHTNKANSNSTFTGHEDKLDTWKSLAKSGIERYKLFQVERDQSHQGDRLIEAIFNITVDQLNEGTGLDIELLEDVNTLNAYGAGDSYNRNLQDLIDNPLNPLNPGFVFGARKPLTGGGDERNVGMSNIDGMQWDFIAQGYTPHINIGGDRIVFADVDNSTLATTDYQLQRIYTKQLGEEQVRSITGSNQYCITPQVSPEGSKVAYACITVNAAQSGKPTDQGAYNIVIANISTGAILHTVTNLSISSTAPREDLDVIFYGAAGPTWSTDSKSIIYRTLEHHDWYISTIDKYDLETKLTSELWTTGRLINPGGTITPDGKNLFFSAMDIASGSSTFDIYQMDLTDNSVSQFTETPGISEVAPSVSFDGRFLFYSVVTSEDVKTIQLANRYTGDVEKDFGNFANATEYYTPAMVATEFAMTASSGHETDDFGTVTDVVTDNRTSNTYSGFDDHDRIYNETRNIVIRHNPSFINYYTPISW